MAAPFLVCGSLVCFPLGGKEQSKEEIFNKFFLVYLSHVALLLCDTLCRL